jgi:hypothetical protein
MRARKEERNQAMLLDSIGGMTEVEIGRKYGLCQSRVSTILINQRRWNEEAVEANRNNIPKRMNHDEMIRYIEDHRR